MGNLNSSNAEGVVVDSQQSEVKQDNSTNNNIAEEIQKQVQLAIEAERKKIMSEGYNQGKNNFMIELANASGYKPDQLTPDALKNIIKLHKSNEDERRYEGMTAEQRYQEELKQLREQTQKEKQEAERQRAEMELKLENANIQSALDDLLETHGVLSSKAKKQAIAYIMLDYKPKFTGNSFNPLHFEGHIDADAFMKTFKKENQNLFKGLDQNVVVKSTNYGDSKAVNGGINIGVTNPYSNWQDIKERNLSVLNQIAARGIEKRS